MYEERLLKVLLQSGSRLIVGIIVTFIDYFVNYYKMEIKNNSGEMTLKNVKTIFTNAIVCSFFASNLRAFYGSGASLQRLMDC